MVMKAVSDAHDTEQALGGILRIVAEMQEEGYELDPRLRDYFVDELGLTDEQITMMQGLARLVASGTWRE